MNGRQKAILIISVLVLLLMFLFPPFYAQPGGGYAINMGYGFLLMPPSDVATVNLPQLAMQWLVVIAIAGVAWLLVGNKSRASQSQGAQAGDTPGREAFPGVQPPRGHEEEHVAVTGMEGKPTPTLSAEPLQPDPQSTRASSAGPATVRTAWAKVGLVVIALAIIVGITNELDRRRAGDRESRPVPTISVREALGSRSDIPASKAGTSTSRWREALDSRSDIPASEAMRRKALTDANEMLRAESDPKMRLTLAATMFLGFFLVNTKERSAFCREQGIDISSFVSAFKRHHSGELARVRSVLASAKIRGDSVHRITRPQLRQVAEQDMNAMASLYSTSPKGACQWLAANAEVFAAGMHISKSAPVVYQVLMLSPQS